MSSITHTQTWMLLFGPSDKPSPSESESNQNAKPSTSQSMRPTLRAPNPTPSPFLTPPQRHGLRPTSVEALGIDLCRVEAEVCWEFQLAVKPASLQIEPGPFPRNQLDAKPTIRSSGLPQRSGSKGIPKLWPVPMTYPNWPCTRTVILQKMDKTSEHLNVPKFHLNSHGANQRHLCSGTIRRHAAFCISSFHQDSSTT